MSCRENVELEYVEMWTMVQSQPIFVLISENYMHKKKIESDKKQTAIISLSHMWRPMVHW